LKGRLFWVSGWVQQSEGKLKFLSWNRFVRSPESNG
jgi:hypothetical protein